ncbi:MAG: ATP-grasp domain-containing protein [Bacteroidetes bacterium]|nr:ATP-grasp domain-containing protein [Bacteroidota bacterium]MBU1718322.1 ATP-grasp domain-containing protein [Bacteroidota bacterium]
MERKTINIAVSGLNNIDSPGPGVAVIRGLREAKSFDVRIIGLAYESLEPAIYMHNVVDRSYQIPYPSAGAEVLMERLEYIQEQENIQVIIPNFDAELYSFMKMEPRLKEIGISMFLPSLQQFEERHKVNLPEFGKKYKIKVPDSRSIFDISELYTITRDFSFPIVVKGKYYDASIAYNVEQAVNYFNKISAKWGLPIIVQEFVHGSEYNVCGLGDGKGNTIAAVPMRKQYITDKGKAWSGISIDNQKMLELTRNFVNLTHWRGGFELELIRTQENDFYLIEINPRIPAWVYLAVGVGQNIPEALVKLALGETVEPYTTYDVGKMFIRYSWDMIVDISEFEKLATIGEL